MEDLTRLPVHEIALRFQATDWHLRRPPA
jgi:hypothetical protein